MPGSVANALHLHTNPVLTGQVLSWPPFHVRNLKHREVMPLAQGNTAGKQREVERLVTPCSKIQIK